MEADLEEMLFSGDEIAARVETLGKRIGLEYEGKDPLVVGVLKGAVFFMADLVRTMRIPVEMDFIAISSYGASTRSSGVVRILKDLDRPVEGRHVLVVEDIVDTGLTLSYLVDVIRRRGAATVRVVTAFDKPGGRTVAFDPDYVGFQVPNKFLVGYGLDYAERYRNLPHVGVLKPSVYRK